MFTTILIAVLFVAAIVAFIISRKTFKVTKPSTGYGREATVTEERIPEFKFIALGLAIVGAIFLIFSSIYTQDAGEAKVLRSFSGSLVGQSTTPGLHLKAPWVSAVSFDTRNNVVTYVGSGGDGDHSGGNASGAQITFQDREGVTGNADIVIRYSINPDAVLDIYRDYQTQENFVSRAIQNDIRSTVRNIPAKYSTIEVFNNRQSIGTEILTALEERWSASGIIVEEVSLQEIRYSDEVKARFDEAQASRIAESKAQAEQEVARVTAETKVIEAQGIADSNNILTQSLSPEVLSQRYIDALKAGTVFVVPEGSTPLVTTNQAPVN